MRTLDEIKECFRLSVFQTGIDGGMAIITTPRYSGSVIWSFGGGWDHVSVCPFRKNYTPTWDDMCQLKEIFFRDDEWVCEFHPAKSDYVNNATNCLHLWKPQNEVMPTPPSWMTGAKKGQTISEAIREAERNME